VPLESQHGVIAHHAASIIGNLNELLPPRLDADFDPRRSGVERILQHLFRDGRRTLHHLAGSDLVRDIFGKYVDPPHA